MSQNETKFGMNRTGIDISPIESKKMILSSEALSGERESAKDSQENIFRFRAQFTGPDQAMGHVPIPGTIRGAGGVLAQKLMAHNPEVFTDQLGARIAFERAGVRLYEAVINKFESLSDDSAKHKPIINLLKRFRDEEAQHFDIVYQAADLLGIDPTSLTPTGDVGVVSGLGLFQVALDPRSSLSDCIGAILTAELSDHEGWDVLIKLAKGMLLHPLAEQFEKAAMEESFHIQEIRHIYQMLIVEDAAVNSSVMNKGTKR